MSDFEAKVTAVADGQAQTTVPVDPPTDETTTPVTARAVQARPIIPGWVLDAGQRRMAATWASTFALQWIAFHGVRTPLYVLRALERVPRGIVVSVVAGVRWLFDLDGRSVRMAARASNDPAAWLALSRERNQRVALRLRAAGLISALALILAAVVAMAGPWWLQLARRRGPRARDTGPGRHPT